MKRGFTLLELMVVIIILGVLATLGVMQYQTAIEKSRGAEARQVIGQIRTACAAIYMAEGGTLNCNAGNLGLGNAAPLIPNTACLGTHFFMYDIANTAAGAGTIDITATRCDGTAGAGKLPTGTTADTLLLETVYDTGMDTWTSTGGY